ncbi:hypothetical protein [Methylobacterium planeticum]|uniref:O-antigen ligase domain-containing protein n=1 Tax=Methylobacterium planeticum TaxID=2615211 RepID=A0A6N6MMM3_9HYPH|nr:hypothetical protein [Methylobacterium planeticum]KAB1069579.1 hypothetical protein F6X51_25050 [Methylobacterium planeticum]
MSIDAIGFITLAAGLLTLLLGPEFGLRALVLSTLLGAASALTIGDPTKGSSVQPAYMLLCFCLLTLLQRDRSRTQLLNAFAFGQPGFWLAATVIYGAFSAFLLPRLFEGQAYVYAVVRTESGLGLTLRPLTPVSGNLTQSIYLFGDLAALAIGAVCATTEARLRILVNALLACAAANLLLGVVDVAAFRIGLGDILSPIRNANYRMLQDGEIVGFKRIVGSFPEASAYAYMTLGLFVFSLRLWLAGVRSRLTGPLALASAAALVLTTSSSGYVGFIVGSGLAYAHCLLRAASGRGSRSVVTFLILLPAFGIVGLMGVALSERAQQALLQLGEATVLNKMSTQSGMERALWNAQAIEVFFATSGLGAGVGSVRASSFLIALISNLGVIGTAFYALFLLSILHRGGLPRQEAYRSAVQAAARAACIALIASASVAGAGVDLGLCFCLLAGLGSSRLAAGRHSVRARRPQPEADRSPRLQPVASGGPVPCPT